MIHQGFLTKNLMLSGSNPMHSTAHLRLLLLLAFLKRLSVSHACALAKQQQQQQKRTSLAFKDIIDLSQQQGHVTELRLPGLAEHLQVLFGDLAGWVEGQRLGCWDDLRKSAKNCNGAKEIIKGCSSNCREEHFISNRWKTSKMSSLSWSSRLY